MEIMRQYRILVVDDDRSILKLVKNVLELDAYDVTTLDRIEELELTHFVGYDLILLDVMMEPVNGFELCSYIRPHLSCPIIFLTAHGEVRMAVEAVQAGALDFLEKPVDAEALLPLLARGCELHRRRRAVARDLKRAEVLWNELTDAERRTAELVAKGLPNRQAAEILGLSEDTVRSRRASVFGKLELHNVAELSEFLHDMAELRTEAHWWRTAE